MNHDREYTARLLARQVLERDETYPSGGLDRACTGDVRVDIEMRGMVQNIRRQVLIDHLALAEKIAAEVERAASEISIDKLVARAVQAEFERVKSDIATTVRKSIVALVDTAIAEKVGDGPRKLASRIAGRVWNQLWPEGKARKR